MGLGKPMGLYKIVLFMGHDKQRFPSEARGKTFLPHDMFIEHVTAGPKNHRYKVKKKYIGAYWAQREPRPKLNARRKEWFKVH